MTGIVLVELFFSWGHMIRPPYLSGGGKSLPYPPPTTLIGALAAPYLRIREPREIIYLDGKAYSPTIKLLDHVKYAAMGYLGNGVSTIIDMNKYYSYSYLRSTNKKKPKLWSSAIGVGKTYSPQTVVIAYIIDHEYLEELSESAWGITRIGSKEGLVSVRYVKTIEHPIITYTNRTVKTIFPAPSSVVDPRENYETVYFWRVRRESYSSYMPKNYDEYIEEYVVPKHPGGLYGGYMKVKPKDSAAIIQTPYSPLIVDKNIIRGGGDG